MEAYDGPFDPGFHLGKLSRSALAMLGREYMRFCTLNDRIGGPQVAMRLGPEGMESVLGITQWMGASPVYTQRMRRIMRIEGDDVPAIMKGLQLDVGFIHQFMDVGYHVESPTLGRFWLNYCGALMDVEPFGEKAVISMCHHMEDPTFDATAVATNPRARIRPIHRPPRAPVGRQPHCHWTIEIDPAAEPVQEIAHTKRVRASRLARLELERKPDAEPGGWPDYDRPFFPELQLEDFSHGALVAICEELPVQGHLLSRSMMAALADRTDDATALQVAEAQWAGTGHLVSRFLQRLLAIPGDGIDAILKVLQLHPAFPHGYVRLGLEPVDEKRGRFWIEDCDALHEEDSHSWFALLGSGPCRPLDAMVQGVNPRARFEPAAASGAARLAWDVVLDAGAEPAPEPPELALARLSGVSRFQFNRRRPLRT